MKNSIKKQRKVKPSPPGGEGKQILTIRDFKKGGKDESHFWDCLFSHPRNSNLHCSKFRCPTCDDQASFLEIRDIINFYHLGINRFRSLFYSSTLDIMGDQSSIKKKNQPKGMGLT